MSFVGLPAKPRGGPRVGTVTSVSLAASSCTVLVNEGEIPAYLTDQVWDSVMVGAVVTILPVGDTYEVISTRTGTGGGGGVILGPELLPNGGFEYGTTSPTGWSWWPWVGGDYTAARDTTPGESVSGSARVLVTLTGGTDAPVVNLWPGAISVDPGVTYNCSAWVKASALEASLVATYRVTSAPTAAGANYFGTGSTSVDVAVVGSPGAAYQFLTGTVTIPTGHKYARPYLVAEASASIAAPVLVSWDDASLRQRITS